jgi:hypothetical protein
VVEAARQRRRNGRQPAVIATEPVMALMATATAAVAVIATAMVAMATTTAAVAAMATAIVVMGIATAAVVAMGTAMAATMAVTMTAVAGTKTTAATAMARDTDNNQRKGAAEETTEKQNREDCFHQGSYIIFWCQ